jgi:TetR/AcrR family transcriptional repressor of nem operon
MFSGGGMGRPSKFDRSEAVTAVMNEVWRNGYEPSSAKALAEKLGITRSSFYNAFESREALFFEVLERYFAQSPDRVLNDMPPGSSILKTITDMFREICRVRAADKDGKGCLAVNCVAELVGVDETLGPKLVTVFQNSLARLESLLRRAVEQGELEDTGDMHEKALALKNLLVGINLMSKIVRSEEDLWTIAEQTLKGLGCISRTVDVQEDFRV